MTVQDEARDLLRRKHAAEDELTAVRRAIDEAIAGGAVRDEATAAGYHARLEAARGRLHEARVALRKVDRR